MSLALTQVYLEPMQKKALATHAKQANRKSSDVIREAIDGWFLGATPMDIRRLDVASEHAERDIKAMVEALDAHTKSHQRFIREINKLRKAAA